MSSDGSSFKVIEKCFEQEGGKIKKTVNSDAAKFWNPSQFVLLLTHKKKQR